MARKRGLLKPPKRVSSSTWSFKSPCKQYLSQKGQRLVFHRGSI